ncbi:MAG: NAD(P)H-dependent oxidoreductase subunit E [Gallionella sp.]|nr:NAD(P)H-dependent oxidoreductase subunit E [Gallionella sp.]
MNPTCPSEQVASIIATHQDRPGALLPILHAIQDAMGFIPPDSINEIAGALNLSRAEVHGVITFYHYFQTTPPARHQIQICCAEACQSMGSERLMQHAEAAASGSTNYAVHPVYCLGLCATSPAMMIDDQLHARVTPDKFDRLINKIGSES